VHLVPISSDRTGPTQRTCDSQCLLCHPAKQRLVGGDLASFERALAGELSTKNPRRSAREYRSLALKDTVSGFVPPVCRTSRFTSRREAWAPHEDFRYCTLATPVIKVY